MARRIAPNDRSAKVAEYAIPPYALPDHAVVVGVRPDPEPQYTAFDTDAERSEMRSIGATLADDPCCKPYSRHDRGRSSKGGFFALQHLRSGRNWLNSMQLMDVA